MHGAYMFDDVLRELRMLERGVTISIGLPDGEDGYFDRLCPHSECKAEFKVFSEDWSNKVTDEKVYCPICRHDADSGEWNTPEQQEYIEEVGKAHLQKRLNKAFKSEARKFNSRQPRGGLIQMSMSYRPDHVRVAIPPDAADACVSRGPAKSADAVIIYWRGILLSGMRAQLRTLYI